LIPGGIEKLIVMDASHDMVQRCKNDYLASNNETIETTFVVGDEEFLPIKER
jgi:NADH dehydrogenase [ubiquinone] 1 alpha subcomplex assembly factor 5